MGAIVTATAGLLAGSGIMATSANPSTTIVQVSPSGTVTQFAGLNGHVAGCPGGGVGLTTALVVLRSGWVIVGSLPTTDGKSDTLSQPGCLIVLDSRGNVRETFSGDGINGPWDMTSLDLGCIAELFVTNVLNGITPTTAGSTTQNTANERTLLRIPISSSPVAPPRRLPTTH